MYVHILSCSLEHIRLLQFLQKLIVDFYIMELFVLQIMVLADEHNVGFPMSCSYVLSYRLVEKIATVFPCKTMS